MAQINCTPKLSHPMYGYGKQDKSNIVIARVSEGINYLTEYSTKNFRAITHGTLASFDPITMPPDLIRCNEVKCHMTGTLWVTPANGTVKVKFQIRGDYTAAAFGINYLYLTYMGTDSLTVQAKVSDYDDYDQANSYTFQDKVGHSTLNENDFVIAQFDFSDITKVSAQSGNGWTPSTGGITVEYTISHDNLDDTFVAEQIGLSSIKTVCSREELRKSDNVLLSCLTSIAPNTSVDATDARCFGQGYDPDSLSIEWSIEATTRSHNDWWLNPIERRGDMTVAGIPTTREFVVREKVVNGTTYGYFQLSDIYAGCNSVIVSIGEDCQGFYLEPLQTPRVTEVSSDEFITLYAKTDDIGGTYVNKQHIGKTVLVTYDAEREVQHIIADDSKLNSFEVEFIVPVSGRSNGKQEWYKFYGLVTEHSIEYNTTDEAALSLTVKVIRRNNRFYDKYIVE